MACQEWIPLWMSRMYGETTPEESARVDEHLARCAACRDEYEAMLATRRLVAAHRPEVPPAPRVMVLPPATLSRPGLAFAAGVLLTALVSVVSFRMGQSGAVVASRPVPGSEAAPVEAPAVAMKEVAREVVDRRLDEWSRAQAASSEREAPLSRAEFDAAIERLANRLEGDRREDLDFLMARIAASDRRTEGWMDDTQRALQYVAYGANPGISPR